MIALTLYRGDKSPSPIGAVERTWAEFCEDVAGECDDGVAESKDDLTAFAPHRLAETCECAKQNCGGGPHRLLVNVQEVTMLVLDVDKGPARDPGAWFEIARKLGIALLVYESASHTPEEPRYRICAPVSRPITVDECRRSRFLFAELMGLAPPCGVEGAKDAAKLFFMGRKEGTPPRGCAHEPGNAVDVDALLAGELEHVWEGKDAKTARTVDGANATGALAAAEAIAERRPAAVDGVEGGKTTLITAIEIAKVTGDPDVTFDVMRRIYNPRCLPPWSDAELEHKVQDAHAKVESENAKLGGVRGALDRAREERAVFAPVDNRPLYVVHGGYAWILDGRGGYAGPIKKCDMYPRLRAVGQTEVGRSGKGFLSTDALYEQGSAVIGFEKRFGEALTTVDERERGLVLVEGHEVPTIEPTWDARVDAWLRALGGEDYPKLEAWIASCAQANIARLAAAVILIGPADLGKSLFASCVAGLWGEEVPPGADLLVVTFNGGLARCPIVFDDEAQLLGSAKLSTKRFREIIQAPKRSIEMKGRERYDAWGALRMVVACNGVSDLRFTDVTQAEVVRAVADRLLVLDATTRSDACRAALASLRAAGGWVVDREAIIRHMAWIVANTELPTTRFVGGGGGGREALLAAHAAQEPDVWDHFRSWVLGHKSPAWGIRDGAFYCDPVALFTALQGTDPVRERKRIHAALLPYKLYEFRPRMPGRPRVWALDLERIADAVLTEDEELVALGTRIDQAE